MAKLGLVWLIRQAEFGNETTTKRIAADAEHPSIS